MRALARRAVIGEGIPSGSASSKVSTSQCLLLSGLFSALSSPAHPVLPLGQVVLRLEGGRRTGARVFLPVTSALGGISGSGCASSMVLAAPRGPRLRPPSSPPTGVFGTVPHCPAALGIQPFSFCSSGSRDGLGFDIGDRQVGSLFLVGFLALPKSL